MGRKSKAIDGPARQGNGNRRRETAARDGGAYCKRPRPLSYQSACIIRWLVGCGTDPPARSRIPDPASRNKRVGGRRRHPWRAPPRRKSPGRAATAAPRHHGTTARNPGKRELSDHDPRDALARDAPSRTRGGRVAFPPADASPRDSIERRSSIRCSATRKNVRLASRRHLRTVRIHVLTLFGTRCEWSEIRRRCWPGN